MRVLLTVHQFLPDYFSGTEVLTYSVARELVGRGHDVVVFTGYPAPKSMTGSAQFDKYDIDGIYVHRFHHDYLPLEGQGSVTEVEYNNLTAAGYFSDLVQEFAPEVIHFFHLSRLGAGLIDVATAAGIPCYYTPTDFWGVCPTSQLLLADGQTCHGPSDAGGNCVKHIVSLTRRGKAARSILWMPDWLADLGVTALKLGFAPPRIPKAEILAMACRRAFVVKRLNALDGIVSPTSFMTEVLLNNGVAQSMIRQSAYGIDLKGFLGRDRIRSVRSSTPLTIGFIGTLAPHKGCLVLIEAFKKLPPSQAKLVIYGNTADFPDYVEELQRQASGTPQIEFRGTFPNTEIADVMDQLDVLVVPSLWFENTPLVIYSALASRAPVIASDFPGISGVVVDGENGLLFQAGDADALAVALSRLLTQPDFLTKLSSGCRPPKSSAAYVDELLSLWSTQSRPAKDFPGRQKINGLTQSHREFFILGWAVVEMQPPRTISVYSGNVLLAKTSVFSPRPDVREALLAQGSAVKGTAFGFRLNFAIQGKKDDLRLSLTSVRGNNYSVPLERCAKGVSFFVADEALLGVDDHRLPGPVPSASIMFNDAHSHEGG